MQIQNVSEPHKYLPVDGAVCNFFFFLTATQNFVKKSKNYNCWPNMRQDETLFLYKQAPFNLLALP